MSKNNQNNRKKKKKQNRPLALLLDTFLLHSGSINSVLRGIRLLWLKNAENAAKLGNFTLKIANFASKTPENGTFSPENGVFEAENGEFGAENGVLPPKMREKARILRNFGLKWRKSNAECHFFAFSDPKARKKAPKNGENDAKMAEMAEKWLKIPNFLMENADSALFFAVFSLEKGEISEIRRLESVKKRVESWKNREKRAVFLGFSPFFAEKTSEMAENDSKKSRRKRQKIDKNTENDSKMAENDSNSVENGSKIDENGSKMAENGTKMAENGEICDFFARICVLEWLLDVEIFREKLRVLAPLLAEFFSPGGCVFRFFDAFFGVF
jgi:hypothetical protein